MYLDPVSRKATLDTLGGKFDRSLSMALSVCTGDLLISIQSAHSKFAHSSRRSNSCLRFSFSQGCQKWAGRSEINTDKLAEV